MKSYDDLNQIPDFTPVVDVDLLTGEQPVLLSMMASNRFEETQYQYQLSTDQVAQGCHVQGVGRYRSYTYIIPSVLGTPSAYVVVLERDRPISHWNLPPDHQHPCNMQVVGNYLVVTVEAEYRDVDNPLVGNYADGSRPKRSLVLIYDLQPDPVQPTEISRISQDGTNSGGAGMAFHFRTQRYYLLADQDDNKKLAVYRSVNAKPIEWEQVEALERAPFGSGAGHNLITASDGSIWGMFFDEDKLQDNVRLYKLIDADGDVIFTAKDDNKKYVASWIRQAVNRQLATSARDSMHPSMRWGAGFRYEDDKMSLLMCERVQDAWISSIYKVWEVPLNPGKQRIILINMGAYVGEVYWGSAHSGHMPVLTAWTGSQPVGSKANINSFTGVEWRDLKDENPEAPLTCYILKGTTYLETVRVESFTAHRESCDSKVPWFDAEDAGPAAYLGEAGRVAENIVEHSVETVGKVIVDVAETVGEGVVDAAETVGEGVVDAAETVGEGIEDAAKEVGKAVKTVVKKLDPTKW